MNSSGGRRDFSMVPKELVNVTYHGDFMPFFFFLSYSSIPIPWNHFPNKLPIPGLGAVLEENKLNQRIIYSLR